MSKERAELRSLPVVGVDFDVADHGGLTADSFGPFDSMALAEKLFTIVLGTKAALALDHSHSAFGADAVAAARAGDWESVLEQGRHQVCAVLDFERGSGFGE